MKATIHNGKAHLKALESFILIYVTDKKMSFEVSGIKSDGTVFIRFKSSTYKPAIFLAREFSKALSDREMMFVQTEDTKFRLTINQFMITIV